jgi:hypothetical protein
MNEEKRGRKEGVEKKENFTMSRREYSKKAR